MKALLALAFLAALAAPMQAQTTLNTGTGTEKITFTDAGCSSAAPCYAQVYRATGACPASGIGTLSYTKLVAVLLGNPVAADSETFTFLDTTPVQGTTYCYYATVTYMGNTGGTPTPGYSPSLPSATFTAVIPFSIPAAPTALAGAWVPVA